MRHALRWTVLLVLSCLSSLPALAQETTGRLEGHVLDPKGQPIPGVNVVATSPALQGARGTQTNSDGSFVILALPVGDYTVKLAHLAYRTRSIEDVHVLLGQTTTLGNVRLQEQVYAMGEIVVTARAALVDPRSTALGENLSARDYQALPIPRDYKSVAALLPHANESALGDPVNFAGATGLENRYFVDGIDVTDPFRSATGTNLPYNFVQEVQVKTGGYEAEYRSSLGGTVNAVTYSGGNDVTGQVFGFFTSNGFSATPRSVPGTPASNQGYALYDVGFGIGGPIRKDRLWYYAAYNPSFSKEDILIPGWTTYEDRNTTHSFAGKLTWRADDKNTVVLTSLGDPSSGRSVQPPLVAPASVDPFLFETRQGGVAGILDWRCVARDNLIVQTTLSRSTRRDDSTPETQRGREELYFIDSTGVVAGGGAQARSKNLSGVTTATLHATWIQRDQEVKAGVEYRDTRLDFDNQWNALIQSSSILYSYITTSHQGHVGSRVPSVFVQHSWRPTQRLVVNDGVRWDGQYWISSEDKVAQTILDEWQPRVGVTYEPGRPGTQKLYASCGRFYQDLTTAPLFWYYNKGNSYFSAAYDHDPRSDPSGADTIGLANGTIQPKIVGLKGQYFDEFTLGYERQIGPRAKLALRGVQRILRQGIEDGLDPATGIFVLGNPGRGALSAYDPMTRRYSAVEASCQGQVGDRLSFLASYVLSRNWGNYEGLFDSRTGTPYPNASGLYDVPDQMLNATGLLPNDHTHVFKLSGSYRTSVGLTVGVAGVVESGMPLSEFGGTPVGPPYYGFIGPRGSHGRTPTVWDLSLRFAYEPEFVARGRVHPRVTLDVLHVASQRKALRSNEVHYFALDSSGNEIDPDPNYLMPMVFQPPMAVRLGVETGL